MKISRIIERIMEDWLSCKISFILILHVSLLCCSFLFKGCLQVHLIMLLSSYNFLCCWKLQQWLIWNEFIFLSFLSCYIFPFFVIFFWNSFHFDDLKFNVNLPMFLFFICNFCMFKWWYHGYFVTLNIVTSFISDLFQIVVVFCCD